MGVHAGSANVVTKKGATVGPAAPPALGTWLRQRRERAGLTQEELAERAGMTARGIAALEQGRRKRPYPHTVRALASALGLTDAERSDLVAIANRAADANQGDAEPALASPADTPTPLFGRDQALDDVLALVDGEARLVTLTGPGGVGKTSLAIEIARRSGATFRNGVAVVALETLDDPARLVPWIASRIGLAGLAAGSEADALHGYLDGREMLLVVDNFEHLLPAAGTVATLLADHPRLRVLATSRAPLRLRREREYPVGPLPVPALSHIPTPDEILTFDAVTLFVERARAASPSFTVNQANATAIAAICRRLDGLPLALELAAARLRILSPTELLARLDQSLPLLTGGARDLPERQRTIRQTIAWSYRILGPAEQALFRRVSIFTGGWDVAAAEAIGADPIALDTLSELVEHSLVAADTADGSTRYRMLETIRAYGREQLDASGETEAAASLHAGWYAALAEEAAGHYYGPDEADWLDRLERDHPNLRAAVIYAIDQADPSLLIRLVAALGRFWSRREHFGGDIAWMDRCLRCIRDSAPSPAGATVLLNAGRLTWDAGDTASGIALLRESLSTWETLGDEPGACNAAIILANMLRLRGEIDEAARLLREARSRLDALGGEPFWLSTALRLLGIIALEAQDWPDAETHLALALDTARTSGFPWAVASALHNLGDYFRLRGDHRRALAQFQESLIISREQRDQVSIAVTLPVLAETFAALNGDETAVLLFGAGERLDERLATRLVAPSPGLAGCQRTITALRDRLGDQFDVVWTAGRSLSPDQVIDVGGRAARTLLDAPATGAPEPKPRAAFPGGLSLREVEVIRLVASGMGNAQVADELYLSRRTVDAHLRRIYDKLDLPNRAAVVGFAHEHGLL